MKAVKKSLKFTLACLPVTLLGTFFSALYCSELFPAEIVQTMIDQLGSMEVVIALTMLQNTVAVLAAAFFGHIMANRLDLWRPLRLEAKHTRTALLLSGACGVLLAADYWSFGAAVPQIRPAILVGQSLNGVLTAVLYGGILEELLLRLFFLSLVALILWKLFWRREEAAPAAALISANLVAALLFAAGHLPATVTAFGGLTPLLLIRCFLYNGGCGLLFGWLYRNYGIQYAMLGHAATHIVSKLIWFAAI